MSLGMHEGHVMGREVQAPIQGLKICRILLSACSAKYHLFAASG